MLAHLLHSRVPPCPLENGLGFESSVLVGAFQQRALVHVRLELTPPAGVYLTCRHVQTQVRALRGLDGRPSWGDTERAVVEQAAAGRVPPWHTLLVVDPNGSGNWHIMPGLLQTLTFGDRCNGCSAAWRT